MYEDDNISSTPKRFALSEVTNSPSNISPTANLKLLTNVALQYPTPPASVNQRKEKSLQILCDRFLGLYPLHAYGSREIQLDATANSLGVEKRRMYDIINILEAIQYAVHKRKNTYLWHGAAHINSFLKKLKKEGEILRLSDVLRGQAPKPPPPKYKALGVLSQRFLMLFLVEPPNTLINLEMAVRVLIDTTAKNDVSLSPEQLERQHKSKVRRLYDIANVYISVGLIEKVSGNLILKKPVFKYIGPIKVKNSINMLTPSPLTPASEVNKQNKTPRSYVSVGRSKRKLQFSTSEMMSYSVGLTTPPSTPSQKWDDILQVADMELTRINNGII